MATLKDTVINATTFLNLPNGTTSERPGFTGGSNQAITPVTGMTRYNTDYDWIEWYNGSKWVCAHVGQTPNQAILDFDLLPFAVSGNVWINPAKALGTGDNPILVFVTTDQDGNSFVALRTTYTNGIISNNQSTTNNVDKVRSEGPNGGSSYIGQYYGLGNVDIAYNGTGGSQVNRSTVTLSTDYNRTYSQISYYNFATQSNLSNTEANQISDWINAMSPYSYQIAVEVDDDNASFNASTNSVLYNGTGTSSQQGTVGIGHPVMVHSWDSNGTIYGDDGTTTTGGMNSSQNQEVFLLTRSRYSSNAVLATRWNTTEQNLFGISGSALGQSVNLDFSQSEVLQRDFIMPSYVSLLIHTGGGNAWGYQTYTSSKNNNSLENYFLVKAEGVL